MPLALGPMALEFDQQITRSNSLIVADLHRANDARYLCAERCQITPDIGVIRDLFDFPALPRIPVMRDCDHESDRKEKDRDRRDVPKPRPPRGLASTCMFTMFRGPVRGWRCSGGSQAV